MSSNDGTLIIIIIIYKEKEESLIVINDLVFACETLHFHSTMMNIRITCKFYIF